MIIKFDQHYYTASIKKGGFYTLDSSPGLSSQDIAEIEEQILYEPPSNLPSMPGNDEIEMLFPTNVAFYKLASGRYAYSHVAYTGATNHTPNRFGNFFAHTLVLRGNTIPAFTAEYIFNAFSQDKNTGTKRFRRTFTIEEDDNYEIGLDELNIRVDNYQDFHEGTFNKFCKFINVENRPDVFGQIFDWIEDGWLSGPGRNITICEEKEFLNTWFLAVNFFLPQTLAAKATFSSYVYDLAKSPFKLTGITPENQIPRLDQEYFKLLKVTSSFVFEPAKGSFIELLLQIISNYDYNGWRELLSSADRFGIETFTDLKKLGQHNNRLSISRDHEDPGRNVPETSTEVIQWAPELLEKPPVQENIDSVTKTQQPPPSPEKFISKSSYTNTEQKNVRRYETESKRLPEKLGDGNQHLQKQQNLNNVGKEIKERKESGHNQKNSSLEKSCAHLLKQMQDYPTNGSIEDCLSFLGFFFQSAQQQSTATNFHVQFAGTEFWSYFFLFYEKNRKNEMPSKDLLIFFFITQYQINNPKRILHRNEGILIKSLIDRTMNNSKQFKRKNLICKIWNGLKHLLSAK